MKSMAIVLLLSISFSASSSVIEDLLAILPEGNYQGQQTPVHLGKCTVSIKRIENYLEIKAISDNLVMTQIINDSDNVSFDTNQNRLAIFGQDFSSPFNYHRTFKISRCPETVRCKIFYIGNSSFEAPRGSEFKSKIHCIAYY